MLNKDLFITGFIPGLIAPFLGSLLFYFLFFNYMQLDNFTRHIINSGTWVSVISLGAILNLGLFIFFFRRQSDRSARGVLGATFVYAFVVVYFKAF
ncbi:MAG TPA: hypothetical protein VJY62_17885 [Bacteroidia bacterium]|jgi:hypothetical protein|nr:hypothetical protein [Bacteroidia bacterium]